MILTFTNFYPPKEEGKSPRAKAGNGVSYYLNKEVVEFIKNRIGQPLEVVEESKSGARGSYHVIVSAKSVSAAAAGPVSPDTAQCPCGQPAVYFVNGPRCEVHRSVGVFGPKPQSLPENPASRDEVQRYIVRQSSAARAVEVLGPGKTRADYEEWTNFFTNLVFEEEAQPAYDLAEVNRVNGGSADTMSAGPSHAAPLTSAQVALEAARNKATDRRAAYSLEDAVCPNCGFKEHLIQGKSGWFCERKSGGCGAPPKGERLDVPITFGEWRQRTLTQSVPWK